jgi:hypothetical protein
MAATSLADAPRPSEWIRYSLFGREREAWTLHEALEASDHLTMFAKVHALFVFGAVDGAERHEGEPLPPSGVIVILTPDRVVFTATTPLEATHDAGSITMKDEFNT